jgi:two-component system OmpR family sensor kinase
VADAAHELRTPLAALSLQAERLQQSEMSDTARERLLRLGSGIDRSKALVAQMLALARAQGGESAGSAESSQRSRFVLKEAVRPVLEDLLPLAQQKEIDLGVDSPLEVEVCSRPLELGLLLSNLIDNAVRYTPPGGRVGIAVTSNAQAGRVRLEITDTGPGIPAAQRERVFEPFYRIDPGAAPGSGLGLSIVQSIAARLDIGLRLEHADAASDRGLRVILDIPAAEGLPAG